MPSKTPKIKIKIIPHVVQVGTNAIYKIHILITRILSLLVQIKLDRSANLLSWADENFISFRWGNLMTLPRNL